MGKVSFSYADRTLRIANKTAVKAAVESLFKKEKVVLDHLSYVFCSDEYLLTINSSFLQHNSYTDIITFDLSEKAAPGITGEIYISLDRVKDNSIRFSSGFRDELLRVVFHGALHLCGYKDKKPADIALMRKKEAEYMALFYKNNKAFLSSR